MNAAFQSGFASALLDVLFTKVTDVVIFELKKVLRSDDALLKLETTILHAQKLLSQADTSEMQGNTFHKLVDKLTSLCYDADDMIEDIVSLIASKSASFEDKPFLKSICTSPQNWFKPRRINKLQEKLDSILVELKLLVELGGQPESRTFQPRPNNLKKLNQCIHFVGRRDDLESITKELLSCSSEFQGVSIVGMDGLGKTTLAEKIHTEARVVDHFSANLWVNVYDGCFNLEETVEQLDQVQSNVVCGQGDMSVLIIFDNLLEVKLADWNKLLNYITQKVINGKRYTNIKFLITTFNPRVTTNTRTTSYYLKPLCDKDSEELIVTTARSLNHNLCETRFLHATTLAKTCGGFPLTASILGVILAQYNVEDLRIVLAQDLWDSSVFQEEIFPALKSCYLKIQSHLKRCLAYLSLFPHNYAFTIDELVHLWVAEGFVQEPQGTSRSLQVGKKHFKEFLAMSILRSSDLLAHNGTQTYEMNQYSHKFAQLAASTIFSRLRHDIPFNTRHLSLPFTNNLSMDIGIHENAEDSVSNRALNGTVTLKSPTDSCIWDDLKKLQHLRTFFAMFNSIIGTIPPAAFKKLTRLRVLSLSGSDVCELPDSIKYLKRLRYLNISHTPIDTIPETLSELHALRFLLLTKDNGTLDTIKSYPEDFQKLTNMIHIDWGVKDIRRAGLPCHIGKLSALQTLPLFPVGDRDGRHISELKDMDHLQGSVLITHLENVKDWAMAKVAALHKKSFTRVELEWNKSVSNVHAKHVLSCLEPCPTLKQLKITNYQGDVFPEWMTHSLPKLEEMHLKNCPLIESLPEHGSPTSLKVVILEEMPNVATIDHRFFRRGHFPQLETLEFIDLEKLQTWVVEPESDVMPRLRALKFIDCQSLVNVSSLDRLSSLEYLNIQRCGALSSLPSLPVSLQTLIIEESDLLNDRCKIGGDDWTKINFIPHVEVGNRKIPTLGSNSVPTPPNQQGQSSSTN